MRRDVARRRVPQSRRRPSRSRSRSRCRAPASARPRARRAPRRRCRLHRPPPFGPASRRHRRPPRGGCGPSADGRPCVRTFRPRQVVAGRALPRPAWSRPIFQGRSNASAPSAPRATGSTSKPTAACRWTAVRISASVGPAPTGDMMSCARLPPRRASGACRCGCRFPPCASAHPRQDEVQPRRVSPRGLRARRTGRRSAVPKPGVPHAGRPDPRAAGRKGRGPRSTSCHARAVPKGCAPCARIGFGVAADMRRDGPPRLAVEDATCPNRAARSRFAARAPAIPAEAAPEGNASPKIGAKRRLTGRTDRRRCARSRRRSRRKPASSRLRGRRHPSGGRGIRRWPRSASRRRKPGPPPRRRFRPAR